MKDRKFKEWYCKNGQKIIHDDFEKLKELIISDYDNISSFLDDLMLYYEYDSDEDEKEEIVNIIINIDNITKKMSNLTNDILIVNKN
jgi:hypothetical protein